MRAAWSGVRPMSPDGLPIVGPAPGAPGLWLLTGFGIDGMPLAPGTARLLTEYLVSERCPAGAEPFHDPAQPGAKGTAGSASAQIL